jgi:hypothetical protein
MIKFGPHMIFPDAYNAPDPAMERDEDDCEVVEAIPCPPRTIEVPDVPREWFMRDIKPTNDPEPF